MNQKEETHLFFVWMKMKLKTEDCKERELN